MALQQPRWRAETARREGSACDQAAETPSSPPWADMLSSLVALPHMATGQPAAAGSTTERSSPAVQWRCACNNHARKLFVSNALALARRQAARAAEAQLEAAAKQVTGAQLRPAVPPIPAAGRRLDADKIVGAAADADAALAAAEIRAAVAKHCSERVRRHGEAAQARPAAVPERVLLPRSTAQRAAAVLAFSRPSSTDPGSHGRAALASPASQLQTANSARLDIRGTRSRPYPGQPQRDVSAAFPVVPRRPVLVS